MADKAAALKLDDENPWPGLAAYDEASKRFFFGREQVTAELMRLIRLSPFVTLYGKSGLGKSSMLQAGLFPQLRAARYLPVYLRLDYTEEATTAPLVQAEKLLQEAIEEAGADAPPLEAGESLWAYLQRRERPIWTRDNFPLTPVLVFDQFEEVFSRGGKPAHIKAVLDSLADLVGDRLSADLARDKEAARRLNLQSQQYRVLLSFRSDFLAEIESWERQANLPKRDSLHLKALSRDIAIDAVQSAGAAVLAPGVAAQIVDFVLKPEGRTATEAHATDVEPVLLSLCCEQLNSRRRRQDKIDAALLQSAGADILQSFYDNALRGVDPKVAVFIEDKLIQGDHYRGSYPRDEALSSGALTQEDLDTLIRRRLLRIDPQGAFQRIELIHDRLVGVVREARDARVARERQQREREEAEQQARSEHERERAERAEKERARLARWRRGLAGTVALLLLALWFVIHFAQRAREQAALAIAQTQKAKEAEGSALANSRRAEAWRLVVESQAMLGGALAGSDERAFQQLLAARQLKAGPEVDGSMFDALQARQHLRGLLPTVLTDAGGIVTVAFGNGRIATGNRDGSVVLREGKAPWHELRRMAGAHDGQVQALMFSKDGSRLLSAGIDGRLRQWSANGLDEFGPPIQHTSAIYSAAYSGSGERMVSGGVDGVVRLWDAGGLRLTEMQLNGGEIWDVAFSADDQSIAVATGARAAGDTAPASATTYLTLLSAGTLREKNTEKVYAHSDATLSVAFSPDGRFIVTGGKDGTLRLRDLGDVKRPAIAMRGHTGDVLSVVFSADGALIASAGKDQTVRLWRAVDGKPLGLPLRGHGQPVSGLAFSADGAWLASAGDDGALRLWPLETSRSASTGMGAIGQTAADTGAYAGAANRPDDAAGIALSGDGALLAIGRGDGSLVLVDKPDGPDGAPRKRDLSDARKAVNPALSPCQPAPARAERNIGALRSAQQRGNTRSSAPDPRAVLSVAISADGRTVVSGQRDGTLRRWDVHSAEPAGAPIKVSGCAITALAWSGDGHRLAIAGEDQALLLDAASGTVAQKVPLSHRGAATALALSADGAWLASAGADTTLLLRDTGKPGSPEMRLDVLDKITSLAFSANGQHLGGGSADGSLRLWDARSGRSVGKPQEAHRGAVAALAFAPNAARFFSVGRAGDVRTWPAPRTWPALMCDKLVVNLSRKAWKETVSADVEYLCQCPSLPIRPDNPADKAQPQMCPAR